MPDAGPHPAGRLRQAKAQETVVAPRPNFLRSNGDSSGSQRENAHRPIALIEGSTPHLSAETRELLRNRLRIAAVLLFVGFFAFLIRWFFYWDEWNKPEHQLLFYTHGLVTIVLGAVLYYILTGRPPFLSDNPIKVMIAHASEEVVPPRQIKPDLPIEMEDIVMRCLEKDPEHRYQDVSELRRALGEVEVSDPWSSDLAAEWWHCNGCPERKKLAAELVEAAAG